MKKYFAVVLIVAVLLSLAACGWQFPGKPGTTGASPSAASSEAAPSPAQPAHNKAVEDFLAVEPSAAQLGQYIKAHAKDLSTVDNDLLLERLLLVQLDVSLDMNPKLWDDPYASALNETMGGILRPEKIPDIQDQTARGAFQMLADGMMTVVRYEESPEVETDWRALDELKDAFGPQAAFMITYRSRLQGSYYNDPKIGYDRMAADIADIEKAFPKTDAGFVRWQLHQLYARLVATLLYGPEGQNIGDFTAGNKEVLDRLSKYAATYGGTSFGNTCGHLLKMQKADQQAVIDMINGATVFPPDDARTIEIAAGAGDGAVPGIPRIVDKADSQVTQQINRTIDETARGMLPAGKNGQGINSTTTVSGSYMSVTLSSSSSETGGTGGYLEKNLIFDLTTGKTVTLDDMSGKPFNAYSALLLKGIHGERAPAELKEPLTFTLSGSGIMISAVKESGAYPDYYIVSFNGLRSFMDVSKLY